MISKIIIDDEVGIMRYIYNVNNIHSPKNQSVFVES